MAKAAKPAGVPPGPLLDAYGRARADVDDALEALEAARAHRGDVPAAAQALAAAAARLRAAEEPLGADVQAAWERNRQDVQDAKAARRAAAQDRARIETDVCNAARRRHRGHPGPVVLTDDELSTIAAATRVVADATAALNTASARFKAGVTAAQLAEDTP